jgi:hypothetical protein
MPARRLVPVVAVPLVACFGALGLGHLTRMALPGLGTPPAVAQEAATTTSAAPSAAATTFPRATTETFTKDGVVRGRVLIAGKEVIRCVWPNGELHPYERAALAAARINLALDQGVRPEEFRAVDRDGNWMVVARDIVVISIGPKDPGVYGISAEALAQRWASAITTALYAAVGQKPPAQQPLPPFPVEVRRTTVGGQDAGVMLVNGKQVLTIAAAASGLSGYERTGIVADRLKKAVADGALPQDVRVGDAYGIPVVQIGETLLVTIDQEDARAAGKTPQALAQEWAGRVANSIADFYASIGRPEYPAEQWQPTEPYEDKWVPIVSILEGVKLGLARVSGPASQVRLVQAVAQLETHWKDFLEIDVYIPISTTVPGKTIDRIKGVGVTGLGDIKL